MKKLVFLLAILVLGSVVSERSASVESSVSCWQENVVSSADDNLLGVFTPGDAVVSAILPSPVLDPVSRTKGGKSHSFSSHGAARKEKQGACFAKPLLYYKYRSHLFILASRSVDKYVYALERIII